MASCPIARRVAALGDVNGDGNLDVLTTGRDEGCPAWLNDGRGRLIEPRARDVSP